VDEHRDAEADDDDERQQFSRSIFVIARLGREWDDAICVCETSIGCVPVD